ncbi:DUF2269 family protein [Cupriavidus necator]|uniref:DUF2269 family protein n=2 Tax=Cupriavidus necator TaxID=106590 RepID=A0A367PRW4_CUPNE|nr:DUF2269 family protein [Cupriavidus necator]
MADPAWHEARHMDGNYLYLKLLHVLVAVVALGTSAGLGIVLELYGDDSTHGSFVLRVIERMVLLVVVPGYVLMLATGLWMVHLAWPFTAKWIQVALGLWAVGAASLGWSLATLRRQRRLHATDGCSTQYRRAAVASRVAGGAFGLVVVAFLYVMVFKP